MAEGAIDSIKSLGIDSNVGTGYVADNKNVDINDNNKKNIFDPNAALAGNSGSTFGYGFV